MKNPVIPHAEEYVKNVSKLMLGLDFQVIANIVDSFESSRKNSKKIFFIGNGGSAATASHFSNDMNTVPFPEGTPRYKAISLADSQVAITCLGNDTGYENVFSGQLKNLLEAGDILVALSASGNSPNIIKAVEYANAHSALTIGFSGFDGGKLRSLSRICLHVPTPKGAYGPVEDVHMMLDHLITSYLRQHVVQAPKG